MYKRWLLPVIFLFISPVLWADTPVKFRRVCEVGANNELFYTTSNDPCAGYFQYKIWGRNGFVGPFTLLDSVTSKSQDNYIHINASPTGATNWFYFIVIIDSCGPDFETRSDTVFVDRSPPEIINLDSVSINPLLNTPVAGWKGNLSSDFSYYKLYEVKNTNIPIFPFNKDTLRTDISIIPVSDSMRYALSSVDSCGKETEFRFNRHVTKFLRHKVDTCIKEVLLSWTPYVGWNAIKSVYIYKQYGNNGYFLYDSVPTGILFYTDSITLGLSYSYFIRSVKDTSIYISSSSNSISFSTRFRKEPINSYLSLVSINKPGDELITSLLFNPGEEVKKYEIYMSPLPAVSFVLLSEIFVTSESSSSYSSSFPFSPPLKYTKVIAYNGCNQPFSVLPLAEHINLSIVSTESKNILSWNPYSTWNVGVNKYRIYRGTNNSLGTVEYSIIDSVSGSTHTYVDSLLPQVVGEDGLCYYIAGVQNAGDVNGQTLISLSTTACVLAPFLIYIPTAFNPEGVNSFFRPEGSSIDYDNSQMDIYDRWGSRIYSSRSIRGGWNGKDDNGKTYMQGVYFYKFFIVSTNGTEKQFSGFVTLLN